MFQISIHYLFFFFFSFFFFTLSWITAHRGEIELLISFKLWPKAGRRLPFRGTGISFFFCFLYSPSVFILSTFTSSFRDLVVLFYTHFYSFLLTPHFFNA